MGGGGGKCVEIEGRVYKQMTFVFFNLLWIGKRNVARQHLNKHVHDATEAFLTLWGRHFKRVFCNFLCSFL